MWAAAAAEQDRGWGGPVAILIAVGVFFAYTQFREWWQGRREIENPSPTPPGDGVTDEDPQVEDGVTGDDTNDGASDDTSWWGQRTRLADGSILVRRAAAVFRTGSSRLPEDDEQPAELVEPEPEGLDEVRGEKRAEFADRLVASPVRYTDAVLAIRHTYQVSESTAKKAIAAARERQSQS